MLPVANGSLPGKVFTAFTDFKREANNQKLKIKFMKTNFGIQLSRNEMKHVVGGYKWQVACVCSGGSHPGDAIICGSNTLGGAINCGAKNVSYCSEGGGSANCTASNEPR